MVNWNSINTVFLDMDGTLLDLHFDNHFWLEHLPLRYAQRNNLNVKDAQELIVPMIMAERGSLNWYCTDYWSDRLSLDITGLKAEVGEKIGYRPHVTEFLDALRAGGLHSVIVTNCHPDPLALKLERTGLAERVDGIYSSHEFGKPKEDPAFWSDLAARSPYEPESTLMVDDSFPVLESALAAGIGHCLAVLAPDSQQPAKDRHPHIPSIHHFNEITPALRNRQPLPSGQ